MKKILSFIVCATIATTVGTRAHAEEVTVKKGDTLWKISKEYNVSVDDVKTWNDLSSDIIQVNDTLQVAEEKTYKVAAGDTLWSIAEANDVSVIELKNWNSLQSDTIHIGSELIVSKGISNKAAANIIKTTNSSNANDAASSQNTNKASNTTASTQKTSTKELTVEATAYTAKCNGCSGITATGINLKDNPNTKVIAVDPSVIPLGSEVYVEGYGRAVAGDTGGAIKGNKIDLHVPTTEQALDWGRQTVKVKILD
ncbi:LysM peptidoglycan-binding and 3D domain-containing protein [Niallia nealsonii]|uniref:Peptidoglycan-binding protein n=1 Tax=Niallia nealsonii TaxID=115979 RepID=A0A2N0YWL7_9BACI|nr:3D domain-containing protein [Niallia nealsonii]PKG21651.1 peptidoglycan-binding protein [Niallia nealsonii]